jgi:hypothetical protein
MKIKICTKTVITLEHQNINTYIFEKGYENNWGDEIFKIAQVIRGSLYLVIQRKLFIYLQTVTFFAQKLCSASYFHGSPFTD